MPSRDEALRVAIREASELNAITIVFKDKQTKDWRYVSYNDAEHRAYVAKYAEPETLVYVLPHNEVTKLS